VIDMLDKELKPYPHLSYTIAAQADEEPLFNDTKTFLYEALEKSIQSFGYEVRPHYFEASSDLRFYLAKGIDSVGLTPFTVPDNIHGTNESVPLEQLKKADEITDKRIKNAELLTSGLKNIPGIISKQAALVLQPIVEPDRDKQKEHQTNVQLLYHESPTLTNATKGNAWGLYNAVVVAELPKLIPITGSSLLLGCLANITLPELAPPAAAPP